MTEDKWLSPASDLFESEFTETVPSESELRDRAGKRQESADPRADRIGEYIGDALNQNDALQAAVGAASGDLMMLQHRLQQALEKTLAEAPDSLTALAEVMPAMNTFMKINQQVEQYVQLSLKLHKAKDACRG